jgi:hypothetical protein
MIMSTHRSSMRTPVGDRRYSKKSTFAAFAAIEEDAPSIPPPTAVPIAVVIPPYHIPPGSWGDLCEEDAPHVVIPVAPPPRLTSWIDLLIQPFSCYLSWDEEEGLLHANNLSFSDYVDMMTWLYRTGWNVDKELSGRLCIFATPDRLPPRIWVPDFSNCCPDPEEEEEEEEVARPVRVRVKSSVIPRFCRGCDAPSTCRYVHGDTIPRLNEPCAFGAGCGASDPTGVKRSQCLRMHPGETWSAELVIKRPA